MKKRWRQRCICEDPEERCSAPKVTLCIVGIPYFDSHIYGSYLIFTNLWHGNSPTNRVGSPIILSCHGRKDPRRLSGYKIDLINYAILDAKNYVPYSRLLKKNHESIQQKSKNNRTEDRRLSAQKFSNPNTRLKRKVQT